MIASMPRTRTFYPSVLLAAVACSGLIGCGSEGISIDELPVEVERRACARAAACGGAESQSACESTLFLAESGGAQTIVAAVKRGTVKYDSENASVCLDAITTDCADRAEPDACDRVFRGAVAAGGACLLDAECAGGGWCSKPDTCAVSCCMGTCQAVGAPVAIGGSCGDVFPPAPCVDGAFCREGKCTANLPAGAPCDGGDECAKPAVCFTLPEGSRGTCTVISTEPGAACVPGANYGCGRADEICNATTSRCTKPAALGAACEPDGACVGYAYCDAATGTCKARPALGESCDTGVSCMGALICRKGTCVEPALAPACVP